MNRIYDVISWTGEWLSTPAALIGPHNSVYITIGHIFLAYFILSVFGLLWLSYKLKYATYPTDEELNDAEADWFYERGCDQEESWR
jgi:hypothetical protein